MSVAVARLAEFDESKHPRDHGRFAEKEGDGDVSQIQAGPVIKLKGLAGEAQASGTLDAFKTIHEAALGYDELASVNDALDKDTVTERMVQQASKQIREASQQALVRDGYPKWFTVFRSTREGSGRGPEGGVVSVSTRQRDTFGQQQSFRVNRSDILTYGEALQRGSFKEDELQLEASKMTRQAVLAMAAEVAEMYALDFEGDHFVSTTGYLAGEVMSVEAFVDIVHARLAYSDDQERDERGRFGKGSGPIESSRFTSAKDVSFADWARQFPKGTVFRAGRPERLEAMRKGADLGEPSQHDTPSAAERINGIWVSDTAKPEYLDTGEVMAAFDVSGLARINEGAPGDFLVEYIPSNRLLGMWEPGPKGARGFDVTPPQMRGTGRVRGIAPTGKPVRTAALQLARLAEFDESKHPRDALGRFGEKGDESEPTLSAAEKILKDNPQQPGENFFAWQGRIVSGLPERLQSEVLFHSRETYEPVGYIRDGIDRWTDQQGLDRMPDGIIDTPADLREAEGAARYFETMPDRSSDPEVERAYEDFKRQNEAMYDFMTKPESEGGLGIRVTFTDKVDPYDTAKAQADDLRDNRHIFLQSGLGGEHSSTMTTDEYDRFRAVHDVFGHAAIGGGFDRHGEYEAWLVHSAMYTPPGRDAMATEYHGVNSAMWSGAKGSPGTGKSLLLPEEWRNPPWERVRSGSVPGTVPFKAEPSKRAAAYIEALGLDADFANHYEPCAWHYDEPRPAWLAYVEFDESKHPRDERGRFSEGDSEGSAAIIEGHARTSELVTMAALPDKVRNAVMAKVTGPVPPEKPDEGWPKDANGKAIVPQPPEGQSWGLNTTPEDVRANYEAMFERAMANPEARDYGMNWYADTHDAAARLAEEYGGTLEGNVGALAAMSAGTEWLSELPVLETMLSMEGRSIDLDPERLARVNEKLDRVGEPHVENGMQIADLSPRSAIQVMHEEHQREHQGTIESWGAAKSWSQYESALEFVRGERTAAEDLNGVKYREFYNNITNPGVGDHVTVDKVMMQIATGRVDTENETRVTGAPAFNRVPLGPTPFLADEIRRIADREGLLANQVQAAMWLQWQKENKR